MSFARSDFSPCPDHWYIVLLIPSCLHRLKSIFVLLSWPICMLHITGPSSLLGFNIMLLSWFIRQYLLSALFPLVFPHVHFPLKIPFTLPWAQSSRKVSRAVCIPTEAHANPFGKCCWWDARENIRLEKSITMCKNEPQFLFLCLR